MLRLPVSAAGIFDPGSVVPMVLEAVPAATEPEVRASVAVLDRLSLGGLKSALQKVIRYGAATTALIPLAPGEKKLKVNSEVFAAVAAALMCASRGSFIPELQLFTRGYVVLGCGTRV